MRIAVFGAGAVGGYFGGRLAVAGEDVAFVARGAHLAALRERGLEVSSIDGDFTVGAVEAAEDPAELGPVEAILIAVKTWQLPAAAARLGPLLGPDTFVVPLLNGVEAPGELARAVGAERVLGGVARIIASRDGPGRIRHAGAEPTILCGELEPPAASPRAKRLLQALARAGVDARIPADIRVAMWRKLLFVASLGAVGAVTRSPVGIVRGIPESRELLAGAMEEVATVARARAVPVPANAVERALAFVDGLPADGTASMQRDLLAGRRSELEGQVGAVVRLGREAGVPSPIYSFLYASLLPLERSLRGTLEPGSDPGST